MLFRSTNGMGRFRCTRLVPESGTEAPSFSEESEVGVARLFLMPPCFCVFVLFFSVCLLCLFVVVFVLLLFCFYLLFFLGGVEGQPKRKQLSCFGWGGSKKKTCSDSASYGAVFRLSLGDTQKGGFILASLNPPAPPKKN